MVFVRRKNTAKNTRGRENKYWNEQKESQANQQHRCHKQQKNCGHAALMLLGFGHCITPACV
jgi:hypothetical protein